MLSDSEYDEYHREYDDSDGDLIIINRMNSHGYSPQGSLHKPQSSEILKIHKIILGSPSVIFGAFS